ncbi:MAG: hypothetical protein RL318_2739 [Fibrobacterota bacterium]|jgi:UDP:flavonoid glycosyltransferase YjiC (YdhE family)
MKVLLAPVGSEGDVRPHLALAVGLREAGHESLCVGAPDFESAFAARGLGYVPEGPVFHDVVTRLAGTLNGRPLGGILTMLRWCRNAVDGQFTSLEKHLDGVDAIVGGGLHFAASSLAQARGIPYRHAVHIPTLVPSRYHTPTPLPWWGLPPMVNLLLWRLVGAAMNLAVLGRINAGRTKLGLAPCPDFYRHFASSFLVAMDPELGTFPPDAPSGLVQTGYWGLDDGELSPEIEAFLQAGEAPVFVGFGSMGDENPEATSRIVAQAVERIGCRAIVAKGWGGLHAKGRDGQVLEVGRTSHAKLFPRVRAVIHHGGAGTTWTAARSGVPQVLVPHLLDQHHWGRRLESLGLAPAAVPRRAMEQGLEIAIRKALAPEMAARARAFAVPLVKRNGVAEAISHLEGIV